MITRSRRRRENISYERSPLPCGVGHSEQKEARWTKPSPFVLSPSEQGSQRVESTTFPESPALTVRRVDEIDVSEH
jgi:hypothetical protein